MKQGTTWASLAVPDGGGVLEAEREEGEGDDALRVLKAWCEIRTGKSPGPSDVAEVRMRLCVLNGAMISMGRTLEKLGPQR